MLFVAFFETCNFIDFFNLITFYILVLFLKPPISDQVRKPAEDFLTSVETNQNYPVLLLSLLNSEAGELNIKVTLPHLRKDCEI